MPSCHGRSNSCHRLHNEAPRVRRDIPLLVRHDRLVERRPGDARFGCPLEQAGRSRERAPCCDALQRKHATRRASTPPRGVRRRLARELDRERKRHPETRAIETVHYLSERAGSGPTTHSQYHVGWSILVDQQMRDAPRCHCEECERHHPRAAVGFDANSKATHSGIPQECPPHWLKPTRLPHVALSPPRKTGAESQRCGACAFGGPADSVSPVALRPSLTRGMPFRLLPKPDTELLHLTSQGLCQVTPSSNQSATTSQPNEGCCHLLMSKRSQKAAVSYNETEGSSCAIASSRAILRSPGLRGQCGDGGGDGGIRTLTGGGLSALPLPIGLRPPRLVSSVVR